MIYKKEKYELLKGKLSIFKVRPDIKRLLIVLFFVLITRTKLNGDMALTKRIY